MAAAIYSYAFGLLMFALAGEATTPWLRWLGFIGATWFVIVGSYVGWRSAREA